MDVKYINPFINATVMTIEMMLGSTPVRQAPYMKDNSIAQGDISGIIGFADRKLSGSVALSFPTSSVLKVYESMMGEKVSRVNTDVQDSVGELANIIAGTAKKEFDEIDVQFHISIPTVVVGNNHTITHKAGTPVVVVPFKMEGDIEFTLEISMKIEK